MNAVHSSQRGTPEADRLRLGRAGDCKGELHFLLFAASIIEAREPQDQEGVTSDLELQDHRLEIGGRYVERLDAAQLGTDAELDIAIRPRRPLAGTQRDHPRPVYSRKRSDGGEQCGIRAPQEMPGPRPLRGDASWCRCRRGVDRGHLVPDRNGRFAIDRVAIDRVAIDRVAIVRVAVDRLANGTQLANRREEKRSNNRQEHYRRRAQTGPEQGPAQRGVQPEQEEQERRSQEAYPRIPMPPRDCRR